MEILAGLSAQADSTLSHREAMELAIAEAQKGAGRVAPNPLVGCVILDQQQRVLAKGYHRKWGGPHAEVDALSQVDDPRLLKGAHVYVTLEPCAHHGRTPPCAETLAKLPLASVWFGAVDPNPLVAGRGQALIREAGISCELLPETQARCRDLAEIFFCNMEKKLPFVAMKVACGLDGQVALNSGESQWITSETSRAYGHFLRASYDAMWVGSGTVRADNPQLNVRHPDFPGKDNKVVVTDREGSLYARRNELQLFQSHQPEQVFWLQSEKVVKPGHDSQIIPLSETSPGRLNLGEALPVLYQRGVTSILVEGGARLYGELLQEGLVDRLYLFQAPVIIGSGVNWSQFFSIPTLDQKQVLERVERHELGSDQMITGRVSWEALKQGR